MSARSFRSVFMVATCAGAALGCYLVSLRVASERAALEDVETKIVLTQRDIRLLQTEIGTRGRLAQLERWNVKVLALSAPAANQFLEGSFQLATLAAPKPKEQVGAPVVLASAPEDAASRPKLIGTPAPMPAQPVSSASAETPRALAPDQLMHVASFKVPERNMAPKKIVSVSLAPTLPEKTRTKPAAAVKTAAVDPLAPKPDKAAATRPTAPSKIHNANEADKD
ncbi:hypothetical protein HMF7854_05490 [Sphingomonas ginkgonis]|uniref:Uncharacterized protein n=1 Tax=Sphingomonas ginkgonis TaxID=2315330 RepID=A0A429V8R3_9SPHN|nr:hypothetical protein [Sphingomonas ginkgonis]RST30336.1 hypothetical protein HMF7854_05490 [Sphingomonas ginkgonis]